MHAPIRWLSFAPILFICLSAAALGRPFFKTSLLGPLLIAEGFFLIWLISLGPAQIRDLLRNAWASIRWVLLFFLYSSVLFAFDLPEWFRADSFVKDRILQHCVLFIYPLMWGLAGLWVARQPDAWRMISFLTLGLIGICSFPNFRGDVVQNISIGPLIYVPAFVCALSESKKMKALAVLLLVVGAVPVAFMWWFNGVQRTTVLNSVIGITLIPLMIAKIRDLPLRSVVRWSLLGYFLIGTSVLIGSARRQLEPLFERNESKFSLAWEEFSTKSLSRAAMLAMQKPEDVPGKGEPQVYFQARFRKFVWKRAILDWLESPIFGRGFVPEIPSELHEGYKNVSSAEYPGAPPVSGPHNSYLAVLARTGIPGALLFCGILFAFVRRTPALLKSSLSPLNTLTLVGAFSIVIFGFVHALFNVGLEGPHNCLVLWVYFGILMGMAARKPMIAGGNP